ncbi:MAG: DUF1501 domain-containing protein [Cyanobacteria bacterium P01_A01_bin.116]
MKRRHFLKHAALLGGSSVVTVGTQGWACRNRVQAAGPDAPRLIVLFLRGAADGLNIVVPYQDADYYRERPNIAIAPPGKPGGVLDLDGEFGLHPSLHTLMPQWDAEQLAFVHACGSSVMTRSHFQGQDYIESGTPDDTTFTDGWLNRLIHFLPGSSPTQAVNMGGQSSLIFKGSEAVTNLAVTRSGIRQLPIDRPQIQAIFDDLYARDSRLAEIYHEGRTARDALLSALNEEMMEASRGAPAPGQFANNARHLARLMVSDASTQVAFMELGQWDTHVNENRKLERNLGALGAGLNVLIQGLGPVYQNTAIVVISEFGRRVAENGNGGTDHGSGNVMWLLGGGIRGKQVYGDWPGLASTEQYESRDLAITTDFRDVLSALLGQHFDLGADELAQIFPDYSVTQQNILSLLR